MSWPQIRNVILFAGGLAGVAYEALGEQGERPTLLLLYAAMLGLPAFLYGDDKRRSRDKEDERK